MTTALLSTTHSPVGSGQALAMERHTFLNQRLIIVLLAVLVLHALLLTALALITPTHKTVPLVQPITVRLVTVVPEKPKPVPPKPIVKPKLVPIVKDLPKPKPLPILVAPKSAPSPVVVAPVEKVDKPAPKVITETAPPAAAPAPVQKAEPTPPKMVDGLKYVRAPELIYPDSARSAGIEGTTSVRTCVGIDGSVDAVSVQVSARNGALDRAALAAVKKARFAPYRENGVAQPACAIVPIQFSLDD